MNLIVAWPAGWIASTTLFTCWVTSSARWSTSYPLKKGTSWRLGSGPLLAPARQARRHAGRSRLSRSASGAGNDWLQGWIALGPRLSGEPYSPDNIAFLATLTDQTTIVVDNAQLLAGARHQADELIALQETALDISAQQDLPVLLQAIIERAARLLGAIGGGMYLVEDDGRQLRLVASHKLGGDYDGVVLPRGTGVAGQVALRATAAAGRRLPALCRQGRRLCGCSLSRYHGRAPHGPRARCWACSMSSIPTRPASSATRTNGCWPCSPARRPSPCATRSCLPTWNDGSSSWTL